jgi:hypothetical protein
MTETKVKKQKKGLSGKGCRNKGAAGEREALRLLEELFDVPPHTLKRNQNQTAFGGADCIDLPYFALEVKRCATLDLTQWWAQTLNQAEAHDRWPLLLYRVDRQRSWTIVINLGLIMQFSSGRLMSLEPDYSQLDSPVAMTPEAFRAYLNQVMLLPAIKSELTKGDSYDKGSCSIN